MATTKPDTTVAVEEVDMKLLARQAMRLYSKRYGKAYDNLAMFDVGKKGYVTYQEFMEFTIRNLKSKSEERAHDIAHKMWLMSTGGTPPEEVDRLTRQLCIDLMIKGFHTSDPKRREAWKEHLDQVALFHFEMIDLDGDGKISKEEWKLHAEAFTGDMANLKDKENYDC